MVLLLLSSNISNAEEPKSKSAIPESKASLRIQSGHSDFVHSLAWSPNREVLATGSADQTVRLWDCKTGRLLHVLSGHELFTKVAWSPDGASLLTTDGSGAIYLWNAETGKRTKTLTGHSGEWFQAVWSPNGETIASAGPDRTLRLWNVKSGNSRPFGGHNAKLTKVIWDPHGRFLVTASDDGLIILWELNSNRSSFTVTGTTPELSPNGRTIAANCGNGVVRLWSTDTGQQVGSFPKGKDIASALKWSPDSENLAIGYANGEICVWNSRTLKPHRSLTGHTERIRSVAWSKDGKSLASSSGKTVRTWDLASGQSLDAFTQNNEALSVAWSPHSENLASAFGDGAVFVRNLTHTGVRRSLSGATSSALSVQWSPDGKKLSVCGTSEHPLLWDVGTGQPLIPFATRIGPARSIVWAPKTRALAACDIRGGVQILEPGTTKIIPLKGPNCHSFSASWDHNGTLLATGGENGTTRLWDSRTGALAKELVGHVGGVCEAVWRPDGQSVATVGKDRKARIWDVERGQLVRVLSDHANGLEPTGLFSGGTTPSHNPGGESTLWNAKSRRLLAEGTWEGVTRYFATYRERRTISGHTGFFKSIAWSPNALMLAASTRLKKVIILDSNTFKEIGSIKQNAWGVSWSPQGEFLATAGWDGRLLIWNASMNELDQLPKTLAENVCALAWSPSSAYLAVGNSDGTVRVWDALSKRTMQTFTSHTDSVSAMDWSPKGEMLATVSWDGTARIWDVAGRRELLALVGLPGGGWATVSPEGFFDCSMDALKHIHWVIGLESAELERFLLEFYQPGLLRDVLENKKPISQILRDRNDPRSGMAVLKKDRRPVVVEFKTTPGKGQETTPSQSKMDLALELMEAPPDKRHRTGSGSKDLRLFRNGTLVWRSEPGVEIPSGTVTIPDIPLVAGENKFVAYAFNSDNIKSRDAELVITGDESLARDPHAHILSIGINQYENSDFNLSYAVPDAEELSKELASRVPVLKENVHTTLLLDQQATKRNILAEIANLKDKVQPEDTVIVSFAGHGVKHEDHFYLVPHNMGPGKSTEQLAEYGVGDEDLEEVFAPLQAARIALIIDACHSGEALEAEEWRVGPMNSRGLPQLAWEKGIEVLAASQSDETAKETAELGHGLLTNALLNGFTEAPRADDKLLARDWLEYAAKAVPESLQHKPALTDQRTVKIKNDKAPATERAINLYEIKAAPLVQTPRVFHGREDGLKWAVAR